MGGAAGAIIYGGEIMNYTMNTLKAIGIILVICGHNGTTLLNWFAPYSFHMALFLFISGYFYKPANEDNLIVYIKKKAKSLIVPYYGWNIFYAILVAALLNVNLINFGCNIDLRFFLIEPWITGHQYIFNLAGWFIFALFNVMLLVALIRKISRNYIRSEYVLTVLFFLISLCGVYLAIHKGYTTDLSLVISRTMFGVFFFQLGYLYKEKLEEKCAELEAERASTVMSFGMTVSFASGTAYLEEYDRNVQDVVKRADRLMYKDKISSGKGRV